jgi:hypothetical protein
MVHFLLTRLRSVSLGPTVKFFPHEVADLEPTLRYLQRQSPLDFETWQTRYSLLLWLSIIVLIPFDLATVDSSHGSHGRSAAATHATSTSLPSSSSSSSSTPSAVAASSSSIVASLFEIARGYLADAGPTRDMAAVLVSRLFSRPDLQVHESSSLTSNPTSTSSSLAHGPGAAVSVAAFLQWTCAVLRDRTSGQFLVRNTSMNVISCSCPACFANSVFRVISHTYWIHFFWSLCVTCYVFPPTAPTAGDRRLPGSRAHLQAAAARFAAASRARALCGGRRERGRRSESRQRHVPQAVGQAAAAHCAHVSRAARHGVALPNGCVGACVRMWV